MKNILIFLLGFLLMVFGFTCFILYFNLFSFGYSFLEYILFLLGRFEFYLFIVGLLMVVYFLFTKGCEK